MSSDEAESFRENRRRRLAQFKNNWGTDLQQIDEEDNGEDILENPKSPIGPRRASTSSNQSLSSSPQNSLMRLEWMRNSHDPPISSWHYWSNTPSSMYQQYIGSESFCDCRRERNAGVQCSCGESPESGALCWHWDESNKSKSVQLLNQFRDVIFHSDYSFGTACVRGSKPMVERQYFWEIKLTSPVYGTDMMIGIGTSDNDLSRNENVFTSMLGENSESWGLSYTGLFHQNGEVRCYSARFSQGSIIGVHLDTWFGTLSFFRNRQPLGIACREGLLGKVLYAMASSTAARSGMRIIRSLSFKSSLQYLCCLKLRQIVSEEYHVLDVLQLPPGLSKVLHTKLDWLLAPSYHRPVKRQLIDSLGSETKRVRKISNQ